jgi:outer membrane receptor protein involved in Fe transport
MIHFFYGHIYQLASFYTMYGERWVNDGTRDTDINSNNLNDDTELYNTLEESFFGNPRLTYEKTISFELGFDWNFYSDYILALSTFYKSSSNQVSSPGTVQLNWWDPAKQLFDFQFTHMAGNGIHEDIQGFELSLKKNFNNYFGFNIAYNIQWAVKGEAGVGSQFWIPDSAFVADGKFWMFHSENDDGSESGNPLGFFGTAIATKANIFLDSLRALGMEIHDAGNTGLHWVEFWGGTEEEPKPDADIRNYGKAQIFIATPDKFGPMGLFGNITANIVYRMSTGNPFEYSPIGGASEWRNGPLTTRTDLSFEKVIYQKNTAKGTLYIQVSNLFDQRDVRGDGGFSSIYGPGEFIRWGMETPRPDNKQYQDYGDFYGNSRYHGSPREIQIGIRTSF